MNLKRLALSFTLMCALPGASLAGETPIGPCAPGQTDTPPCSQSVIRSTDPSEMNSPPSNSVDVVTIVEAVQLALSLF